MENLEELQQTRKNAVHLALKMYELNQKVFTVYELITASEEIADFILLGNTKRQSSNKVTI